MKVARRNQFAGKKKKAEMASAASSPAGIGTVQLAMRGLGQGGLARGGAKLSPNPGERPLIQRRGTMISSGRIRTSARIQESNELRGRPSVPGGPAGAATQANSGGGTQNEFVLGDAIDPKKTNNERNAREVQEVHSRLDPTPPEWFIDGLTDEQKQVVSHLSELINQDPDSALPYLRSKGWAEVNANDLSTRSVISNGLRVQFGMAGGRVDSAKIRITKRPPEGADNKSVNVYNIVNSYTPNPGVLMESRQSAQLNELESGTLVPLDSSKHPLFDEIPKDGLPWESLRAAPDISALLEYPGTKLVRDEIRGKYLVQVVRQDHGDINQQLMWKFKRDWKNAAWELVEGLAVRESSSMDQGLTRKTDYTLNVEHELGIAFLFVLHWYSKPGTGEAARSVRASDSVHDQGELAAPAE